MNKFNIRVYGLWVKDKKLLLSDEFRMGIRMTKLPGGGLEFNEGPKKGLQREWMEELGVRIEVGDIFYVNPFHQVSAFDPDDEIIAMYFWVEPEKRPEVSITEESQDFLPGIGEQQNFRWKAIDELSEEDFTFPIDKSLVHRLKAHMTIA